MGKRKVGLTDAQRYRVLRHYLSPKMAAQILMLEVIYPAKRGWSKEDWVDAHVDAAARITPINRKPRRKP